MTLKMRPFAKTASTLFALLFATPVLANGFTSPSGNILCYTASYDDAGDFIPYFEQPMVCLIFEANWDLPPYYGDDNPDCGLDRTRAIKLPVSGPATEQWICHGDVFWPLPLGAIGYGSTWSLRDTSCDMATNGVTCDNGNGGRFSVNRAGRTVN